MFNRKINNKEVELKKEIDRLNAYNSYLKKEVADLTDKMESEKGTLAYLLSEKAKAEQIMTNALRDFEKAVNIREGIASIELKEQHSIGGFMYYLPKIKMKSW